MLGSTDDVMGVITRQIEDRFQMPLDDLRRSVTAAPQANPEATSLVHWYGLLAEPRRRWRRPKTRSSRCSAHPPASSTTRRWRWPTRSALLSAFATAAPWS